MSSKISLSRCLRVALTTFFCKLRPKNFFFSALAPPRGYAYGSYRQMKFLILMKYYTTSSVDTTLIRCLSHSVTKTRQNYLARSEYCRIGDPPSYGAFQRTVRIPSAPSLSHGLSGFNGTSATHHTCTISDQQLR